MATVGVKGLKGNQVSQINVICTALRDRSA